VRDEVTTMLTIRTRVTVKEDGTVEAKANVLTSELSPGEHEAVLVVESNRPKRQFRIEDFPIDRGPWDDTVSLRREDMYGDDGR
jgi:hypothetical protein